MVSQYKIVLRLEELALGRGTGHAAGRVGCALGAQAGAGRADGAQARGAGCSDASVARGRGAERARGASGMDTAVLWPVHSVHTACF